MENYVISVSLLQAAQFLHRRADEEDTTVVYVKPRLFHNFVK